MASAVFTAIVQAVATIATKGLGAYKFLNLTGMQAFAAWTATWAGLGAVSKSLFGQPEFDTQTGINFNVRDPAGTRKIIYGKCRIGGTVVFMNTSDINNSLLHLVIAVAGHEIESYEEIYFGEEKVWESGSYLNDWDDHCLISLHKGDQTTADSNLLDAATGFTSDHKLLDTAYAYIQLDYDRDKYAGGIPNISFIVKGKKVYNPVTETTAWTDNSALILYDYLTDAKYGLGESASNIDQTALASAIDVCEEPIYTGSSLDKYTCNGILDTGSTIRSNVENILSSMMGTMHYTNGKFHILPFADRAPHADKVTEDILVSPINISTKKSRTTLYNTVKGKFISLENNYIVADYPKQSVASYIADDDEEIPLDLDLPMTTNVNRAQRIAGLTMKKSRMQMTINVQLNMQGLKYKVGDNINIVNARFGWTDASPKRFEITNMSIIPDPERGIVVQVDAVENESSVYSWSSSEQQGYVVPTSPTSYTGTSVISPTGLKVYTTGDYDRGNKKRVKLVWNGVERSDGASPFEPYFSHYEITVFRPGNKPYTKTTTDTEIVVDILSTSKRHGGYRPSSVEIRAINTRNYRSTPLIKTGLLSQALYPDEPELLTNTVVSDISNPTPEKLTELANEIGVIVGEGSEITYVEVDSNGNPINSTDYVFESIAIVASRNANTAQEVDGINNPELVSNGDFSSNTDWVFTNRVSEWVISNGTLSIDDATVNDFAYQTIDAEVGTYIISFDVIENTGNSTLGLIMLDLASSTTKGYPGIGTGSQSFTYNAEGSFMLVFVALQGDVTIDNVSVKLESTDAIDKFHFRLPVANVDVDFDYEIIFDESSGQNDNGVTTTFNGFDNVVTDRVGHRIAEITLQRAASYNGQSNVGTSILTVKVIATWEETEDLGGVDTLITKTSTRQMTLAARVL